MNNLLFHSLQFFTVSSDQAQLKIYLGARTGKGKIHPVVARWNAEKTEKIRLDYYKATPKAVIALIESEAFNETIRSFAQGLWGLTFRSYWKAKGHPKMSVDHMQFAGPNPWIVHDKNTLAQELERADKKLNNFWFGSFNFQTKTGYPVSIPEQMHFNNNLRQLSNSYIARMEREKFDKHKTGELLKTNKEIDIRYGVSPAIFRAESFRVMRALRKLLYTDTYKATEKLIQTWEKL